MFRGRTRSPRRPQSRPTYRARLEPLEDRVVPSVDVLTYHNDLSRDGANLGETVLTPSNVSSTNFGKLFSYSVDGQVYAEPLYKSNVVIPGQGTFNVVFVATEHDSVYAFDADSNTTGPSHNGLLWKDSFLGTGITPFSQSDAYGCSQITPEIGITATPVIDGSTGTLYVVAQTKQVVGSTTTYHQKLHALDITTGAEKFGGPVEITASVPGTGDGGTTVTFHAQDYKERPGLVLVGGVVYTSWSSHCDINPSGRAAHGWVIGYNASTLAQTSVFCTSPNGNLAPIWEGGGSLAVDGSGNLYFETGNGSSGPSSNNYSEAFVKLSTSGGTLSVADYFIPANYQSLDSSDEDIGSGAPIALPDQPGSHTHLLIGAGKDGRIFVTDRDNMGQLNNPPSGPDNIVQELPGSTISGGSWDTPAYFDAGSDGNRWIYYAGSGDHLKAFSLSNGLLSTSPTSQSSASFGYPGATPVVSANGTSNAIVWAVQQGSTAVLRAYDALNLATELYDSNQAGTRDQFGSSVKFATPTVAGGKVFVGTTNSLTVFGLLHPVLAPIPDQTVPAGQQTLTVTLSVTNPTGSPLTYSATGQSLAYAVTQTTGTLTYNSVWDNWGGRNEKWLQAAGGQWYFILPSGELDRWDGSGGANGTSLGLVGTSYYSDPTRLTNPPANQPHATFSFSGNVLTVTRDPAWVSGIVVTVTVSNSQGSDTKSFNVTVTGAAPMLAPMSNQTIPSSQQTLTVSLSVTNPSGDPLTYSATGQSLAYVVTQMTGTLTYNSVWDNWGGRGEKWLQATDGTWYFILPSGELDRWDGSGGANGTSLGLVGTSYYSDPTRLTNPPANQPHATFSFSGAMLTVTRDLAWVSGIVVTVTVSNDQGSDSKTFDVFVTG
jgi:hypothetical protein